MGMGSEHGHGGGFLKDLSVLYVEDDIDVLEEMAVFLKRRVGKLVTAMNGQEGLSEFINHRPDVVVSDVRMPVMDGLKMSAEIKKLSPGTPIVVTTASSDVDNLIFAIDIGIDKYVLKPVDPKNLEDALVRIAGELFHKKEIEARNRYVQFILDLSPGFIVTTEEDELEYVNKAFLAFLGFSTLGDFKKAGISIEQFILKINDAPFQGGDAGNLVSFVLTNRGAYHTVCMKDPKDDKNPKVFLIICEVFPTLNRHILFFTDITGIEKDRVELKRLADKLLDAKLYAEGIIETVHESLVVLDDGMRVVSANKTFYDTFKAVRQETEGRLIYELGNRQWDIPRLRQFLDDALPGDVVLKDYALSYDFPAIGAKTMLLNAKRIMQPDGRPRLILLAIEDITERKALEDDKTRLLAELQASLDNVKLLGGLLPICASCKMIRDDKGYWQQVETYIREHSEADFTHSICPDCIKNLYPDFHEKAPDK